MNRPQAMDGSAEKRMLSALHAAAEKLEEQRRQQNEPLAVIGMACRFPGAPTLDDFWSLLQEGRSAVRPVPTDRWNRDSLQARSTKERGKITFNGGGFLDSLDQFDPRFFEITHREARSLDPQHRLLLEVAWETLEHAGIPPASLTGDRCGVFTGICASDYLLRLNACELEEIDPYFSTGNSHGTAAGRLSYFLKWEGPCLAVDTACSSSLVAVHLAMQSLRSRECDYALALGVNVILAPHLGVSLSQAGMLSPGGASRAFAAGADGFVRGEGCGAVLLKRLSQAVQDRDPIFAVLKGSAVNQDGRSNGLTAPNGNAQQAVIRAALARAALAPDDIDYLEAHGTGTELGDPIEMNAVSAVFCPRPSPLHVGSVKTNIGHLEGAAGIAGLIKTCLALHHRQRPAHLHWDKPSPHIDWRPEIVIPTTLTPWMQEDDRIRRAGVSSFGFGGTNAHVVLEEAPAPVVSEETRPPWSWMKLSAKTSEALEVLADCYAEALESGSLASVELDQVVLAANAGRSDFAHRLAIRATTRRELIAALRSLKPGDDLLRGESRGALRTGWIFPSLGSTEVEAVADTLAAAYPVFRRSWHEVQSLLGPRASGGARGCGFQASLAELWRSFSIVPAAVRGFGPGRFAAALSAGVLTLDEALHMAAMADDLGSDSEAANRYRQAHAKLPRRVPQCLWYASKSIGFASVDEELDATGLVVFPEGRPLSPMDRPFDRPLLIVGPVSIEAEKPAMVGNSGSALAILSSSLMHLYVQGVELDWTAVQGPRRGFFALPSYPFQRQRCWFQEPGRTASEANAAASLPAAVERASGVGSLLGERVDVAGSTLVYETDLSRFPSLADHRLHGRSVFPAVGYLELATAAGRAALAGAVEVCDMRLEQALRWEPSKIARVQVVLEPQTEGEYVCRIFSQRAETGWQRHAECRLTRLPAEVAKPETPWTPQGSERSIQEHYAQCEGEGLHYAGSFRSLRSLRTVDNRAWGEVRRIACDCEESGEGLSPGMLDGCLQSIAPLLMPTGLWLPTAIGRYVRHGEFGSIENLRVEARLGAVGDEQVRTFQLLIRDDRGRTIAEIENLVVRLVRSTSTDSSQHTFDLPCVDSESDAPHDELCSTTVYTNRIEQITQYLRVRIGEIIECEPAEVDPDIPFERLGFDSMAVIVLLDDLERIYGMKIPMERFLGGITLNEIVKQGLDDSSEDCRSGMDATSVHSHSSTIHWVEGSL